MEAVATAVLRGLESGLVTTAGFFWDSLYGLIFGFLISAIVQTTLARGAMERFLGPNLRGIVNGTLFGIIASACSYGAAAAARGFYQKGADARSVFAFTISSTNMNLAILIMFWAMLGWRFAFAEFFGGIVIIAVVCGGLSALFGRDALRAGATAGAAGALRITDCLQCGMEGDDEHAVAYDGRTYLFCGSRHEAAFRADPAGVLAAHGGAAEPLGLASLRRGTTWTRVVDTMLSDVEMLRSELLIGFFVAGFAAALVPAAWLASALRAVGSVPFAGYPLLLLAGLLIAVATFVCSMGNVPIARFLATAGIPLGANTTFIYGDLLIPPLVSIYRKSFPRKLVVAFLALFVVGAMLAGALMDIAFGNVKQAMAMGSPDAGSAFTIGANVLAIAALIAAIVVARVATAAKPVKPGASRSLPS